MSAKNKEIVEKVNASFAEGGVEGFCRSARMMSSGPWSAMRRRKERMPFANGWLRWI